MKTYADKNPDQAERVLNAMAFPLNCGIHVAAGLSKREWFAGLIASGLVTTEPDDLMPRVAVELADRLILELAKAPAEEIGKVVDLQPNSPECEKCGRLVEVTADRAKELGASYFCPACYASQNPPPQRT